MNKEMILTKLNKNKVYILIGMAVLVMGLAVVLMNQRPNLAGKYELASVIDPEGETMQDDLSVLGDNDLSITMELKNDGSGVFNLFGQELPLTWTNKEIVMNGETIPIKYKDHLLEIKDPEGGNSTLVFEMIKA